MAKSKQQEEKGERIPEEEPREEEEEESPPEKVNRQEASIRVIEELKVGETVDLSELVKKADALYVGGGGNRASDLGAAESYVLGALEYAERFGIVETEYRVKRILPQKED